MRTLDDILRRMHDHQDKKISLFRELHVASAFVRRSMTAPLAAQVTGTG
jgi:hypothetical protein